jgi:hypothetical protein
MFNWFAKLIAKHQANNIAEAKKREEYIATRCVETLSGFRCVDVKDHYGPHYVYPPFSPPYWGPNRKDM